MITDRLSNLRAEMTKLNVDTFMITEPDNRRYLSGFTGSNGVLLITPTEAKIATDFRYFEQVKHQCPDFTLLEVRQTFHSVLPTLLAPLGSKRVAFEADDVTYDQYQTISAGLPAGIEMVPTKDIPRWLRAVKEPEELALIKRAIAHTDRAITIVSHMLQPGMTEREIAWKLEQEMHDAGGERPSFDLIVAAGPASAMPHARPTDRPLRAGEPIVIDMGCRVEGYCSDLTRTYIIGEPDAQFKHIYDIVLQAQQKATREIRPGMIGKVADGIARQVIVDAGYGDFYGHGLGHGVGYAIHELPVLGMLSEHTLKTNHVFSIEPGIYLPEWGGVRIEDLTLLGDAGPITLSQASKDPVIPLR